MNASRRRISVAVAAIGSVLVTAGVFGRSASAQSGAATDPVILAQKARASSLFALSPTGRPNGATAQSVATINGLTVAKLQGLASDSTVWVSETGRLFYVESAAPASLRVPAQELAAPGVARAVADVFALHSRPGSSKTIYLDFTGEVIPPGAWNTTTTITAGPLDSDGSPSTFSAAERSAIETVWDRVSEDYAPFDVDVTTEEPTVDMIDRADAADNVYGTRAVITSTPTANVGVCGGCGGVAYVGVFNLTAPNHQYYQPAFVFTQGLGFGKPLAEATSHELGHNLNLYHDGVKAHDGLAYVEYYEGQGSWAPIMGVGYYQPIVQFSKGEYDFATNAAPPASDFLQNDFAVIATQGLGLVPDEAGSTTGTAVALTDAPNYSGKGIIASDADTDVFSLPATAGETVTVLAKPAFVSPNLDISLTVLRPDGSTEATNNPDAATQSSDVALGLDASLTFVAPTTGTYYVSIAGTGFGTAAATGYSSYGSIGRYTVTASRSQSLGAPTAVGASTSGSNVTVTWTPPASNGGTPITYYRVQLNAITGGTSTYLWTSGPTTTLTLTGITPGTYNATVQAYNGTTGPASTPSPNITVGEAN
jgi:hypothetical protein